MIITGKKIVVTGAASGIGKALVGEFAEIDCEVIAVDHNAASLQEVCSQVRGSVGRVHPVVCELGDPVEVDDLFARAIEIMGGIDLFVANAGFPYYELLSEPDWVHIEKIFQVNVVSPIYSAWKMKSLDRANKYKVVMTASGMAKIGLPGYALYSATKAAIDRFADAYRDELSNPNQLMLVYPIATRTHFFDEASPKTAPVPWPSQSSEQVARAILAGIKADRKAVFPSKLFWWVWRLGAFIPGLYRLEQYIELRRLRKWVSE